MTLQAAAIIPAAGFGTRMQLDHPKQYHLLSDIPVLVRTVRAFIENPNISEIVVVVPEQWLSQTEKLFAQYRVDIRNLQTVAGGDRRQDSVYNGLLAVSADCEIVLVHDGARPLISQDIITRCYHGAVQHGAVIAAVPVKDTLKKGKEDGKVAATVDRTNLFQAQTPQAVRKDLLIKAYHLNRDKDVTDESSLLEKAGISVTLVDGAETNMKITRPEDLVLAEQILRYSEQPSVRIGHGFDAHRFERGRRLVLGGITIDHSHGLAGHSDADVLTHALCDAILGAVGAGDIGKHFPDNDASFKGVYSILLLEKVIRTAKEKGYFLSNADITVVCQAPKLSPYIDKMREMLGKTCLAEPDNINIKATTTEKMGFTGRKEGISCHAVVLLQTFPKQPAQPDLTGSATTRK